MSENTFLSAVQQTTAGAFTLGQLIDTAAGLAAQGDSPLAQQLYKIWISFNRDHPQLYVAHFNCAVLQTQANALAEAIEELKSAIALNADFLPAYINLGGLQERAGGIDLALETWATGTARLETVTGPAIGYKLAALKQMGRVLAEHQKLERAEAALFQSLLLNPNQRDVIEQYVALRLGQCKWPTVAPWEGMDRKALVGGIHPLSMAAYTDDPLLQLASAWDYVARVVDETPATVDADRRDAPIDLTSRRLRVGYISSDLRDHAVGYLMAEVFELHDKAKVEVFAYYCGPASKDPLQQRTKAAVEHWVDIRPLSDDEAAARIAADGIDILVDVNGHTRDARTAVFARRPAPIQVNWLGYPGTMGSPYHHYLIADPWIVPPASEIYYSEKVVRLPCYQPNDRKRAVGPRPSRADAGLPDDAFVFCCFNGAQKISRFTFERWMQILQQAPNSVLWLLDSTEDARNRLAAEAQKQGVGVERLFFAPKLHNPLHLARYPLADLFLDTAPYGAHTTCSDALWMGVPILTLSGRSFASRVCGSLVRAAGLGELVVETPEAFVARAVELAGAPGEIASFKARLEAGRASCDLFNMEKLVESLEALYRDMCADRAQGLLPKPDLANLDVYLKIGVDIDHEASEMLAHPDYQGLYRAQLASRHRVRPIPPDTRLWTPAEIAALDGEPAQEPQTEPQARARRTAGR